MTTEILPFIGLAGLATGAAGWAWQILRSVRQPGQLREGVRARAAAARARFEPAGQPAASS
jgi:hypothetical protein